MSSFTDARNIQQSKTETNSGPRDSGAIHRAKETSPEKTCETYQDASGSYIRYIPSQKPDLCRKSSPQNVERQPIPSNDLKRKLEHPMVKKNSDHSEGESSVNYIESPSCYNSDICGSSISSKTHKVKRHKLKTKKALNFNTDSKVKTSKLAPKPINDDLTLSKSENEDEIETNLQSPITHSSGHPGTSQEASPVVRNLLMTSNILNKSNTCEIENIKLRNVDPTLDRKVVLKDEQHKRLLQKLDRSLRRAQSLPKNSNLDSCSRNDNEETSYLHGLTSLPQPKPVDSAPLVDTVESLPLWLANPIRVIPQTTANFEEFGLQAGTIKALQKKGFTKVFAVQSAAFRLLLPGSSQSIGDVVISAATGSGKTLSYVLPMILDLSQYQISKLRGLIILPTRELVSQARKVAEICAAVFSKENGCKYVKIGTAVGNEKMKTEQSHLIENAQIYDPKRYDELLNKEERLWQNKDDIEGGIQSIFESSPVSCVPGFLDESMVKVNVIICTPGRLVEHLKYSPGISLKYIKWLVIDEADKLLDQSFQQWLPLVISGIDSCPKDSCRRDRVRKIVLSATISRVFTQLSQLKLYRPSLISLESEGIKSGQSPNEVQKYILPSTLLEYAIKVEKDDIKPLYLIELLKSKVFVDQELFKDNLSINSDNIDLDFGTESSSNDANSESSRSVEDSLRATTKVLATENQTLHGALIFCKSNEIAARLGRLMILLFPSWSVSIGILTSTLPHSTRRDYLNSFVKKKISVLVASDLVSRGLDLPDLAHVINYDIPHSITSYIHRVGRTARAGKVGNSWTFFTNSEAGWFWNEIGGSLNIQRSTDKIKRFNLKNFSDNKYRERYQSALKILEKEVTQTS